MNVLILTAVCLAVFGLLFFIDTKVKGNFSVLTKVLSVASIAVLLGLFVLWYGQTIFETMQVDIKSLTNLKSFFNSRILGMLAIIVYLILFLKTFYYIFRFIEKRTYAREEKAVILLSIVFDIAVIPNIVLAGGTSLFFIIPAVISVVETGLALTKKLVFSFNKNEENGGFALAN